MAQCGMRRVLVRLADPHGTDSRLCVILAQDKWRNMHPSADGEPSPSKLSPTVKRAYTSGSLGFGRVRC